jgi:hypothetical protein
MESQSKLSALIEVAESCGIKIRHMPSAAAPDHPGGALVKLRGEELLFLDPSASVEDQAAAVAMALRGRGELQDRFLPPELRDAIDHA